MKTIKVFIASSEELRLERLEFIDMIQQLNRILKPRGVEIDPVKWEYLDASMGSLHKQEEYNRELKTCEMCLVLYWTRFGDYTKSELDTAYSELCAGRNPQKLYVYFKDADDITPELKAFKESFATAYGHFFCRFENVDTMKLNFLLQFEDYQNKTSEALLKVRDSRVEVDGLPFVELKNVPFAGNNPEYLQLLKQIESTQARVLKYPDDREFRQELHDLQERRKAMESSLLDTAKLITRLSSTVTSARLAEAMRLFEAGDNKGANAILNLDEISHDAEANATRIDAAREIEAESVKALESNIEEYRLKIKTLQNAMEKGWVNEVIAVYDRAVLVARNRIAQEKFAGLLKGYADFLLENRQFHLIGSLYGDALIIYNQLPMQDHNILATIADILNSMASIYQINSQYKEAEDTFYQSLDIYRSLARKEPEIFNNYVAKILTNLGLLHLTKHTNLAEKELCEALAIRQQLYKNEPQVYSYSLASTLHNMAGLYYETNRFSMAEHEYVRALNIYKRLSSRNPNEYMHDVVETLNNLAFLHIQTKQLRLAEKEYYEALTMAKDLAKEKPEAHEYLVALILTNLSSIHYETKRYKIAEKENLEALEIYRRLSLKNPGIYELKISDILYNLSILHTNMGKVFLAMAEIMEAKRLLTSKFSQNK